ncbi:MAG: hypothetical protein VW775_04765 [Schleiferiaceae bacterium]
MKKYPLLFAFLLLSGMVVAQERAITSTGDEVILYQDGTWTYADAERAAEDEVPTNPKPFTKAAGNTFLLKITTFNVGFWINPTKWSFKKAASNDDAEYELQLKGEDLYGMIITEQTEIPLETMRMIAVENAKDIAPDVRIVEEEYRTVNGTTVMMLKMHATMQGIKIGYYSYYYSNERGTVQFVTYTSQSLLKTYEQEIEGLLNGLVVL